MHKCEECHCLTSASENNDNHMTDCSKYDPAVGGFPRKKKEN